MRIRSGGSKIRLCWLRDTQVRADGCFLSAVGECRPKAVSHKLALLQSKSSDANLSSVSSENALSRLGFPTPTACCRPRPGEIVRAAKSTLAPVSSQPEVQTNETRQLDRSSGDKPAQGPNPQNSSRVVCHCHFGPKSQNEPRQTGDRSVIQPKTPTVTSFVDFGFGLARHWGAPLLRCRFVIFKSTQ